MLVAYLGLLQVNNNEVLLLNHEEHMEIENKCIQD